MWLLLLSVNNYLPLFRANKGFCWVLCFLLLLSPMSPGHRPRFPPESARGGLIHKVT